MGSETTSAVRSVPSSLSLSFVTPLPSPTIEVNECTDLDASGHLGLQNKITQFSNEQNYTKDIFGAF